MAFNLDISNIKIPGAPDVPVPAASGITDTSKTLVDRITSNPGALFSNPMVGSMNFLGGSVDRLEFAMRRRARTEMIPTPGQAITPAAARLFLGGQGLVNIQNLRSNMGNFMVHTDRLSGLLQSQGIATPGLQQIMSIGKQMQTMMTLINASSGCLTALGGATGIFSGETIDAETSKLDQLTERIISGAATIAEVTDTVVGASNLIKGIMDKDSQFLQNCANQLQASVVGLALEALNSDPCMAFMFQTVSNKNPGGLLDILSKNIAK